MGVKLHALENDLHAWELLTGADWMNVLPSTWVFRIKRFPDGLLKKFKVWFYVCGDLQKKCIDYFETWCHVVQWTTVLTIMILATSKHLVTAKANVTAEFVLSELAANKHMYVHQPAPYYFFTYLKDRLEFKELDLKQSACNPCLFVGHDVVVVVYVEEILLFAKDNNKIQRVVNTLEVKGIAIHQEGTAEGFLDIDIECFTSQDGHPWITFQQKGITACYTTALSLDSSLSTRLSTPAKVGPLPKRMLMGF
ncbi:hypothetical protein ACHAW6_001329 [Cyclotella cf. meneghiniana]